MSLSVFLTTFSLIFFAAEMGDKTQLMTAALAAQKIPLPFIKTAAGGLFIVFVFGAVSLVQEAVLQHWLPRRLGSVLC